MSPHLITKEDAAMSQLQRGSRGPEVVTLQRELNRQLFPTPNLTPDGVFGGMTDRAVRAFQRNSGLKDDGIVGPRTRAALGMPDTGRPFTHRVRLQFLSISLTDVPFNTILAQTQAVYAPYGIKIEFAGGMSLRLDSDVAERLQQVQGSCEWEVTDGDFAEILRLGGNIPPTNIGVFYIDRFSDANLLGCGGHMKNRPACIVAKAGSRYDTAHEICHVMLGSTFVPVHADSDPTNLMHPTASTFAKTPLLTDAQVTRIKQSHLCVPI